MVVVKIGDGMGNQLFNYACGYALARRDGEKLKLDISECDNSTLRDYELDFFKVRYDSKESFPNRNFWQKLYKRLRRNLLYHVIVEKDLFSVDTRIYKRYLRNRYLHGYWQNVEYFKDYLDELREMYVPREPLRPEMGELLQKFSSTETCAVHVRGGDINGPSPEYFKEAMRRVAQARPGVRFVVFTNDKAKAAECIAAEGESGICYVTDLGEFSDKEEFLLMSSCKNHVISNSSYSTWAAYLCRNREQLVMVPVYPGAEQMCLEGWQLIS